MGGSRSHSEFFVCLENHPKITLETSTDIYIGVACVFCQYTLLKVVGYCDECSLHVSDGFPKKKKFGWGWVGGVSSIYKFFLLDFWNCFNFAKPLRRIIV